MKNQMNKMKKTKQIEIELRALIDVNQYRTLKKILSKNAKDLGEDNKDTYYYLTPKKVFKVVKNISKKTAKIVYKSKRLGRGKFDAKEIEISIKQSDFDKALDLFSALEFSEVQRSFQKRHNYLFKGVEIALKHSESWGYHIELEIVVRKSSEKKTAIKKIQKIAGELGITLMSEKETMEFSKKVDQKYDFSKKLVSI